MGNRVKAVIKASGHTISASFDCSNRLTILGYIEQNKPDVVIFCTHLEGEDAYMDTEILREIFKSAPSAQTILIVEKHSRAVSQIALECDIGCVISSVDEVDLTINALQRIERKRRALMQEHADKMQRLFADFIKDERRLSFDDKNLLLKGYLQEEYFQMAVVRILPPYRRRFLLDENNLIKLKGYDLLTSRLEAHSKFLIAKDGPDILICLMGNSDELNAGKQQLEYFLKDMNEFSLTMSRSAAWVCMGSRVKRMQEISSSYHAANDLINKRIFSGSIAMLEKQRHLQNAHGEKERFQVFDVRKTLENSLETLEEFAIHKTLAQLKSNILSAIDSTDTDLFSIYKTLMSALFRELERKESNLSLLEIDYDTAIKEYEYFWNIDDVFNSMERYFLEGINILKVQEETSIPAPIVLAKQYIRAYFNMPLTLQEISSYISMNENYFSDYFKKCTQMTFKQYQTDLRIRHSKQMLLDKRYTMEDISDAVGYNDVKYFSRVFKQVTGNTPGEYRKKYHIIGD